MTIYNKMKKNNKGITLVTLAVTIIVLLIIAGVSIKSASNLIQKSKLKNKITDMLLIQARAEVIYEKNQFDTTVTLVGVPIDESIVNSYNEITETTGWYIWDKSDRENSAKNELEGLNIELEGNEYYIVNYEKREIISSVGFTENNVTIHSLTEMQKIE